MRLTWHGWLGLAIIVIAQALLFAGNGFVGVWFTPIVWTGYILLADAVILRRTGRSLLHDRPRELPMMALLSVLSWLAFEVYNLRLANWAYVGLPENMLVRNLGFFWAFATIFPGIFQTADLLEAFGAFERLKWPARKLPPAPLAASFLAGLACVAIPIVLPVSVAPYTFGLVWLGFIFLLEPVNLRLGAASIYRDLEQGRPARMWRLLTAGLVCGLLWEFWNYWATTKWVYIFPLFQNAKLFEMPLPGFLGFPPFALECFAMYHFLRLALHGDRLWGAPPRAGERRMTGRRFKQISAD